MWYYLLPAQAYQAQTPRGPQRSAGAPEQEGYHHHINIALWKVTRLSQMGRPEPEPFSI